MKACHSKRRRNMELTFPRPLTLKSVKEAYLLKVKGFEETYNYWQQILENPRVRRTGRMLGSVVKWAEMRIIGLVHLSLGLLQRRGIGVFISRNSVPTALHRRLQC